MSNRIIDKKYYCIDCDKEIYYTTALYGQGRCKSCARKHCPKIQKVIYKCIDCKVKINYTTIKYGGKRCHSCASKLSWRNPKIREKTLKASMRGRLLKPNKKEKLLNEILNKLFPNEYKFVGDGKVFLGGFCPDFINCNGQKKIIELYGDYWHKMPNRKIQDKRRIKTYTEYRYKTLIIWQHELKDLNKLEKRILQFNK